MDISLGKARIHIVQGDITEQDADAIVNAANSSLQGGGGVNSAIHRKGGQEILEQCKRIRERDWPDGLPAGKSVITTGGRLKARFVIHTVGPVWYGGSRGEPQILTDCYRNSLTLAKSKGLTSVVFPSISTGAFGYPIDRAGPIAMKTVEEFVEREDKSNEITFVLFTDYDLAVYETVARNLLKNRLA